ncbi:hypothetical protein K437DRAFT_167578 [Tilletiaria anomala UBC 951]|uniref:Uncharacterized protein n=1 Tax=Tilletiaria anomala (strain ATCC 24038 / CBS 436.72 / UBC 951) TaxID=1037660 RepID=A0A066VTE8_TILAU|nr:uncharacterized protein K437DRAFT_167578 [Tilletiaria anomala UBC 951]KDN42084.1 hypothetical protein K437DRAFT_167578 [Tilletiaria anomala UBC 951]
MDGVDGNPTEVPQGTQPSVTPQPTPKQDANKGISRPASLRSARSVVGSSSCASALSRAAPSLISRLSAPATGRTTATATSTSPSFSDGFGQGPTSKESALCATLNTTGGNIASLDLANSGPSGQLQGNSRYDAESSSASPMSRVSFSEDTAVLGGSIAGTSGNWISGWSSSTQTVNEDDEEPDDGERGIEAGSHQEDGTDAGGRRQSIGLESGPGSALALLRDVSTRSSSRVTTFSSFPSSKANGKQREVEEEDIVTLGPRLRGKCRAHLLCLHHSRQAGLHQSPTYAAWRPSRWQRTTKKSQHFRA